METLTMAIVAALGNLSAKAVGDAYEGLKALVLRKFGAESELVDAVKKLEQKPDSVGRKETLSEEVQAAAAHKDAEIIKAAEALLAAVKAHNPAAAAGISQTVKGDGNIFSGSGNVSVSR